MQAIQSWRGHQKPTPPPPLPPPAGRIGLIKKPLISNRRGLTLFRLGFLRVAQLRTAGGGKCPRPITLKLFMIMT